MIEKLIGHLEKKKASTKPLLEDTRDSWFLKNNYEAVNKEYFLRQLEVETEQAAHNAVYYERLVECLDDCKDEIKLKYRVCFYCFKLLSQVYSILFVFLDDVKKRGEM